GDARQDALSGRRVAALPADAGAARLLLVPAGSRMSTAIPQFDEAAIVDYVRTQRWFGGKSRELTGPTVLDSAAVREVEPTLHLVLAELRYPEGTHDTYQLLLAEDGPIRDALADDTSARELVQMIRRGTKIGSGEGSVEFQPVPGFAAGTELQVGRRI